MIYETIITSVDLSGKVHVTPFGVREEDDCIIIAPFKPSTTLDNILTTKHAVMNLTDDVRVFAGSLTHKPDWPLTKANEINGYRLADCIAHVELTLTEVREDEVRPQLVMQKVFRGEHGVFKGFNRAQAAVVELAVLASRLHMLPPEKVATERAYLQIAIDKTAGPRELEAWQWLTDKLDRFYSEVKSKHD